MRDALHHSHATQREEQQVAITRHQAEYDRLQGRIHAMYVDKLDGIVDDAFFERMSAEWRKEQEECLRHIERLKAADQSYLEDGVRILELANNARTLFDRQQPREKRRLLDFVLSNSTWKRGELHPTLRQPFDLIAETATAAAKAKAAGRGDTAKSEIWLAVRDSNSPQSRGLESFKAGNGSINIRWSVSNGADRRTSVSLHNGTDRTPLTPDSPYWTAVAVGGDNRKAAPATRYFEVSLPRKLFDGNPRDIKLHWVDFFRR